MRYIFSLLFLLSIHLGGNAQKRKEIKNDALEARDSKHDIFIEMNDGKILTYSELKIKHPVMGYEYLEGDGKRLDIASDSIRAFQTDKFYALRLYTSAVVIGKLPFTELFAQRIRNGKIELFIISEMKKDAYMTPGSGTTSSATSGYVSSYFLRKGKTGKAVRFSKPVLKEMIKDNSGLAEEFDKLARQPSVYEIATEIIDEYN